MSYKMPRMVIPGTSFLVENSVLKPTCGRWTNIRGKFSMPLEISLFTDVKDSQETESALRYSLSEFLVLMGEDPYGSGRVDGLTPEAWSRIKQGMLELIYTEFGLEYPIFSQAEKV